MAEDSNLSGIAFAANNEDDNIVLIDGKILSGVELIQFQIDSISTNPSISVMIAPGVGLNEDFTFNLNQLTQNFKFVFCYSQGDSGVSGKIPSIYWKGELLGSIQSIKLLAVANLGQLLRISISAFDQTVLQKLVEGEPWLITELVD